MQPSANVQPLEGVQYYGTYHCLMSYFILVKPSDLVATIKEALENDDNNKVDKILSGALKQLKNARLKVDNKLNEALSEIAIEHPSIFDTNSAIEVIYIETTSHNRCSIKGLLSVLKKETSAVYKTKSEPATYALAAQLLMIALKDSLDWPEALAKVYYIVVYL